MNLQITASDDLGRILEVNGSYPDDAGRVARSLPGESLTGLALSRGSLVVGVPSITSVPAIEDHVRSHPLASAVGEHRVIPTLELLSLVNNSEPPPGLSDLFERLVGDDDLKAATQTSGGVEISLAAGRASAAAAVFRRTAAAIAETSAPVDRIRLDIEGYVSEESGVSADLAPDSDPRLLLLLEAVRTGGPRAKHLTVEARTTTHADSLHLTARAPALAPELERMAMLIATWHAEHQPDVDELWVSVRAIDREGRSPSTGWRVDLTGAAPAITETNGTDESIAELRQAWQRGLDAAGVS